MAQELKHLHILIRAHVDNPAALNEEQLKGWTRAVIAAQDMEIINGPFVATVTDAGNKGPTGGAHIKTSHFAYHIWEETGVIQADLYTCGELHIKNLINAFDVFKIVRLEYMVIDREAGFNIISAGKISGHNNITRQTR